MFERKKIISYLIPALLLALMLGIRHGSHEKAGKISHRLFDGYQSLKPRVYKASPVRFIDIDDESLDKLGQWPWPRTLLAKLVSKLSEKGASAIVMDIVFAEPDRTSPARILPLWTSDLPELKALQTKAETLADHDQIFSEAISKANVVTGFTLLSKKNGKAPSIKSGFAHSGEDPLEYLSAFQGAIPNIPLLEKEAAGSGSFNFLSDDDGILRRVPLLFRYQDQLVPSLAAEGLRVAQGASGYVVKSSGASGEVNFGVNTGILSLKIGDAVIPTDSEGRLWLYDTGKISDRYLSAWKVLSDQFDSKLVEGNIVFIGSSAAGLKDMRTTPLNSVAAGTEIHVQLTEQILNQEFLNRPDWAFGAENIFLLLMGSALIVFLPQLGAALCALFGMAAAVSAFGFSWYAFAQNHWLLDPVTPFAASFIIYLVVSLMNYLRTESEKNQIRGAFGQYLSPALLEKISKNPGQLKLGGEMRPMTILFADIRNFTSISEQYSAEELTRFMNHYLTPMTDIILKIGGTIDKYIGDCIMAFWNAPLTDAHHARHACEAALAMQGRLKTLNQTLREEALHHKKEFIPINVGIGINTGECCVGNMGSDQRFDYSVLGDDVNLTSRLEGQCKFYNVSILIGQNTQEKIPDLATLELDLIRVKGRQKPIRIFALLGGAEMKSSAAFSAFQDRHKKMLTAYQGQQWKEAEKLLEILKKEASAFDLEGLYPIYEKRIQTFLIQPPETTWDGGYTALEK